MLNSTYTLDENAFEKASTNLSQAVGTLSLLAASGEGQDYFADVSHHDLIQTIYGCRQMVEEAHSMLNKSCSSKSNIHQPSITSGM